MYKPDVLRHLIGITWIIINNLRPQIITSKPISVVIIPFRYFLNPVADVMRGVLEKSPRPLVIGSQRQISRQKQKKRFRSVMNIGFRWISVKASLPDPLD